MKSLRWRDVWHTRLRQHFLVEPAARASVADVVGAVCGIHAQVMPSAELSLGLRTADATQTDVRDALDGGTLVRTFGLRSTVHLFPAHELSLWLTALRERVPPRRQNAAEYAALPRERLPEVLDAMREALASGQPLTKAQLAAELERRLGPWITEHNFPAFGWTMAPWQLALAPAAWQGLLAFGPNRGPNVTYVSLPPLPAMAGHAAQQAVLRRYLRAYGPTTHVEFARWFLTEPRAARTLLESLEDEIEEVDVEGWRAWQLRDWAVARGAPSVHLLPQFDCYVVGCHPRDRLLPESLRSSGTAAPYNVLLIDGVVGGLWTRQRRGKRLDIRIGPFGTLTRQQRAQATERAERIAHILDLAVDVSFGDVDARRHL